MNENEPKLTRGDLIKGGLAGLTLLAVGCAPSRVASESKPEKIDPKLFGYREGTPIATGLHWVRGVAVAGNDIWVAGDMALVRLSTEGKVLEKHELPSMAKAVAVAPDGHLFAATDDQIVLLENGKPAGWPSLGPRARIVSLLATKDEVYAADAGERVILRYSRTGKLLARIGEKSEGYPGLIVPSPYLGFGLLPDGSLLVSNPGQHRVEHHSSEGKFIASFGEPGQGIEAFCGCCNPSNLLVMPGGEVVTAEKGIPRVKVLHPDGKLALVVAGPDSFHPLTAGIDLALMGKTILVLDPHQAAVRVFEPLA